MNLAQDWVIRTGQTVEQVRHDYDGACIDFAGDFLDAVSKGRLAYFENIGHPVWRYHAAAEIDGMIHDLWTDKVMTTEEFIKHLGGGDVCYPADE